MQLRPCNPVGSSQQLVPRAGPGAEGDRGARLIFPQNPETGLRIAGLHGWQAAPFRCRGSSSASLLLGVSADKLDRLLAGTGQLKSEAGAFSETPGDIYGRLCRSGVVAAALLPPSRQPVGTASCRSRRSASISSTFSRARTSGVTQKSCSRRPSWPSRRTGSATTTRRTRSLSSRISDRDIQEALKKGVAASNDIFAEAWTKAGYAVVTDPGPDVLRVNTGIVHIGSAHQISRRRAVLQFRGRGRLCHSFRRSTGLADRRAAWPRDRPAHCRRQFRRLANQQQQSRGFSRDGRTLGGRKRARDGRTEIASTGPALTHSIEMRDCSCQLTD